MGNTSFCANSRVNGKTEPLLFLTFILSYSNGHNIGNIDRLGKDCVGGEGGAVAVGPKPFDNNEISRRLSKTGEQGWRSDESTHLPQMWPRFDI